MNVLVDTSVWSLALRRDAPSPTQHVEILQSCLDRDDTVLTTGLVLQELLQGFRGPAQARRIVAHFSSLPVITPDMDDHVEAAALRNECRRHGAQVGTIDVLLAQLCLRHDLALLTADRDFEAIAKRRPLRLLP